MTIIITSDIRFFAKNWFHQNPIIPGFVLKDLANSIIIIISQNLGSYFSLIANFI